LSQTSFTKKRYSDKNVWRGRVGVYIAHRLPDGRNGGTAFTELVGKHFYDIERANHAHTVFSLAYGAVLILSHTSLKFYRGHRYVILGANGSGKSTLIRQLRDGKVENPQPPGPVALRCVMVEHSLQGEGTSLSVIDLIVSREPCLFTPESRPIDVFIIS